MIPKKSYFTSVSCISFCALIGVSIPSYAAQMLPAAADPSRIKHAEQESVAESLPQKPTPSEISPEAAVPENAKQIKFKMSRVKIEGSTAFSDSELSSVYEPYIGQEVSLDTVWLVAKRITEKYRNAGYFLCSYVGWENTLAFRRILQYNTKLWNTNTAVIAYTI